MSQVTNLAFFRARHGQREARVAARAALVEPTRLEAGCLNYDLHRSVDDADVWFVRSSVAFGNACRCSDSMWASKRSGERRFSCSNIDLHRFRMISRPHAPHLNAIHFKLEQEYTHAIFRKEHHRYRRPETTRASPSSSARFRGASTSLP
jgi:hypothetical protein